MLVIPLHHHQFESVPDGCQNQINRINKLVLSYRCFPGVRKIVHEENGPPDQGQGLV